MSRVLCLTLLFAGFVASPSFAQNQPKDVQWTHAFDLACRKLGENEFSPSTRKFGVEALRDLNNNLGMYVTETGSIALAPGFENLTLPVTAKGPIHITGLDLPARKAGEKEFTNKTKVHCLEVFRDPNTDNIVYITSEGRIAAAPAKGKVGGNAAPKWVHSVDLNVRKGGVKEWKDAQKIGLEIYRDSNTGNLIYISDSGSLAVIPEVGTTKANDKAPAWLHGLDLEIRKANEKTFTKETSKFGVEVFRDETNGNLIFIAETGALAVIPGDEKIKAPTANIKQPVFTHGYNVKARKFGEKDFTERTTTYGGEVFRDDNVGAIITVSENGNIAAALKK